MQSFESFRRFERTIRKYCEYLVVAKLLLLLCIEGQLVVLEVNLTYSGFIPRFLLFADIHPSKSCRSFPRTLQLLSITQLRPRLNPQILSPFQPSTLSGSELSSLPGVSNCSSSNSNSFSLTPQNHRLHHGTSNQEARSKQC